MRINFKKVSAIAASVLMVGMTMIGGVTAAQNYPAPFVKGGVADVAIVYGTGTGYNPLDIVQAGHIQSSLQSHMGASDGSTTVTGDSYWEVGTGSDKLELAESISAVTSYIGDSEFALLADGSISNEKGEADYTQNLYFDDTVSSSVLYTEDDSDNIGLFFKINSGQQIAKYVMDFTTNLKSDIDSSEYSDIEDKDITFLGKTYTIVDATNGSAGAQLTLMSGALGGEVTEGTPLVVDGYTVDASISSATEAKFTITTASGTETTDKMAKGDMEKLSNGNYLAVTDITWEGGDAGNDQKATFYIGADKIEWKNGTDMTVNGETINNADVLIASTESGADISISEISINMTAEDDLFVPVNGKLSEADDLDEPEVLVSQNWDIQFEGLESVDYEDISLKVSGSDKKYTLKYLNYAGDEVTLPLLYTNGTATGIGGTYGGEDADKTLVLDATGIAKNVTKKDYFFVHTADPADSTSNAKTVLVRYNSADKTSDTDPKVSFTVNPGASQEDHELSLKTDGTFTLDVAGAKFTFANASSGLSDDFDIYLTGTGSYADGGVINASGSNYIRTYYNTLINITDGNVTAEQAGEGASGDWIVNVTVDDGNRDGDAVTVAQSVFYVTIGNTTADATATFTTGTVNSWQTDPDDSNIQRYISNYGVDIVKTDSSDSPADIEVKVPKNIVRPLVYVSTGDLTVSSTSSTASTSLGEVLVTDSEVSTVSSKNLIVVGGSCINSVAANLLGGVACGSDFTTKTGIGSGQFLIQSLASTYSSNKIALVVAGYNADDTVNAATYLRTQTVDTTKGNKYTGTTASQATLSVATA